MRSLQESMLCATGLFATGPLPLQKTTYSNGHSPVANNFNLATTICDWKHSVAIGEQNNDKTT